MDFLSSINGLDLILVALIILIDHKRRYWKKRATRYYMGGK